MKNFIYLILVMTMVFANSLNVLADDIEYTDPEAQYESQYESQVITRPEFKICDMKLKRCLNEAENFTDMSICYNLYIGCVTSGADEESADPQDDAVIE